MNRRNHPDRRGMTPAMRLPRGVTGFWLAGQTSPQGIDQREFRTACHMAARLTGGHLTGFTPARPARSFVAASVAYPDRERAVLCNLHWPLTAMAEPIGPDEIVPVFVHDPELTRAISRVSRFRTLTPTELATSLDECDLSELGDVELAQIRYWKPLTVGETAFNCWD